MLKKFYSIFIFFLFIICFLFSNYNNSINFSSNSMILPTDTNINNISSYYGYRELWGSTNFHNGIDFPMVPESNVYATLPGIVTFSDFTQGYGICVTILHDNGLKSLYGHLSEGYRVKVGERVNAGEIIAYVGTKYLSDGRLNGATTGPHLHFTLYDENGNTINPLSFEYQKINGTE